MELKSLKDFLLLAGEALVEMQGIADAVAAERERLKASKAAATESVAKDSIVPDGDEGSASTAEAYFQQRIADHHRDEQQNDDSFQV